MLGHTMQIIQNYQHAEEILMVSFRCTILMVW